MTDQTTDVATTPGTDLSPAEIAALASSAVADVKSEDLQLPNVKLTQQLTKEVVQGDVDAGVWLNTLTQEEYGDTVSVVIVKFFYGRFYSDKDTNRGYAAFGDVVPNYWPEKYAGQRFVDLDDAEERYKELANADVISWGKGPPISTTYNFVGYLLEDGDVPERPSPVRFSLMRTSAKAARKVLNVIKLAGAPWDQVITLEAERADDGRYFETKASTGRQTSPDEKGLALQLAQVVANAGDSVALVGDEAEADATAKREAAEQAAQGADALGI